MKVIVKVYGCCMPGQTDYVALFHALTRRYVNFA